MSDEDTGHKPDLVFETDELLGEFRDAILDEVKRHLDWTKLNERKQHNLNNEVEQRCRQAIRAVVEVVHGHGFQVIPVIVSGLKQGKEGMLEAKIGAEGSVENVVAIYGAGRCSLVLADPGVFMAARPAPVMKDQPDLMEDIEVDDDEPIETEEARTLRENGERIEAGIKPLAEKQAEQVEGANASGAIVDDETGEVVHPGATIPPRAPRGHRGKRPPPADQPGA